MRLVFSLAVLTAFLSFGCASKSKTAPPAAETPAAAAPDAAAKPDAKAAPESKNAAVTCEKQADKRILEVRAKDKGCELAYTKNGQEAVVASSHSGPTHCQTSLDKIKGKLEAAGFTCK